MFSLKSPVLLKHSLSVNSALKLAAVQIYWDKVKERAFRKWFAPSMDWTAS